MAVNEINVVVIDNNALPCLKPCKNYPVERFILGLELHCVWINLDGAKMTLSCTLAS